VIIKIATMLLDKLYTMSHVVNKCPLMKFPGGLQAFHSGNEDSITWLRKQLYTVCVRIWNIRNTNPMVSEITVPRADSVCSRCRYFGSSLVCNMVLIFLPDVTNIYGLKVVEFDGCKL